MIECVDSSLTLCCADMNYHLYGYVYKVTDFLKY